MSSEEMGEADHLPASPAERVFREHLERADYVAGVGAKRWRLISLDWPTAIFAVRAGARESSPEEFSFRINLDGYPGQAPHGHAWDPETEAVLAADKRPKGERVGLAFRADWDGLYLPTDRSAVAGHTNWRSWRWDDRKDISFYLRLLHELLNDEDYKGV
jgi:hypothetical protein